MLNAHAAAAAAYGGIDARLVDPMRAEALVLAKVTRRLEAVASDPRASFAARAATLDDNRRLWRAIAAAVADEANAMPEGLRAQLLSLAGFVERRTSALLRDRGDVGILAEINRRIAGGLTRAGG